MLKRIRIESTLQRLALGQLILIGLETVFGIIATFLLPAEGGNGIVHSIALLLISAFAIPACLTIVSAAILVKPNTGISAKQTRLARGIQLVLFILCILLLVPSVSLATQGFVVFAVNCVLGLVLWPMVNKESKTLAVKK